MRGTGSTLGHERAERLTMACQLLQHACDLQLCQLCFRNHQRTKRKEKAINTRGRKKKGTKRDVSQLKCNNLLISHKFWGKLLLHPEPIHGHVQLPPWLFPAISPRGDVCIRTVTAGDSLFHFPNEILLEECLCANNEGAVNSHPISPHAPIWSLLSF